LSEDIYERIGFTFQKQRYITEVRSFFILHLTPVSTLPYLCSKTRIELLYAVRTQSTGALWHLLLASI